MSSKRFKAFAIAVLGMLLSVAFVGTQAASAEEPAEIYMVSPQSVELPAVIVLASPKPNMSIDECYQGVPDPNNYWNPAPGTGFEFCDPYLAKRTGPDSNGLYYFVWKLPMSPPGQTVFREVRAWGDDHANGDVGHFSFTVVGNRFRHGDFRSCIDFRTGKALIAWYALNTTEVVFKLEQKIRRKQKPRKLVWRKQKPRRQKAGSVWYTSSASYEHRFAGFRVPDELVRGARGKNSKRIRSFRARYVVKLGKKVLKRGWISRRLCRELPFPPYALP